MTRIYDTTRYADKPAGGIRMNANLWIMTNDHGDPIPWFPDSTYGSAFDDMNESLIKSVAEAAAAGGVALLCLDVEPLSFNPTPSDLLEIIGWVRDAAPTLKLGMYDHPGVFISNGATWSDTQAINDTNQSVLDALDVSMPSLYTKYDVAVHGMAGWSLSLVRAASESERTMPGKPVIPFGRPEYDDNGWWGDPSNPKQGYLMESPWFLKQVQAALKVCDGIVVWGGGNPLVPPATSNPWDNSMRWYLDLIHAGLLEGGDVVRNRVRSRRRAAVLM
ncbi:MAG TPA: hypothetical protein VHM90_20380 [Phycisphaerae bacterium]|jgi:hypothetical protein|nr:hypothetical protein [Phycisphaerae bacterium]